MEISIFMKLTVAEWHGDVNRIAGWLVVMRNVHSSVFLGKTSLCSVEWNFWVKMDMQNIKMVSTKIPIL